VGQLRAHASQLRAHAVTAFGNKGHNPADAMQSVCKSYGLNFQERSAADAVTWAGLNKVGMVIGVSLSQDEMQYYKQHHIGISPAKSGSLVKHHAMAIVRKQGEDLVVQNSWGAGWSGDSMSPGRCTVQWDWLIHENAKVTFWTVRKSENVALTANAYAGRGVAGAAATALSLRAPYTHVDVGNVAAEVQANSSGVAAVARASVAEHGIHNQHVGGHYGLQADTGVIVTSDKFEVSVLGFGLCFALLVLSCGCVLCNGSLFLPELPEAKLGFFGALRYSL